MGMIEVTHFRKSFGPKLVHQDVTFKVERGECLGLIGGSGVGKSVILRSLIGLEKPDSGSIKLEGNEITHLSEDELTPWRKRVAYAFQGGALFDSMTVYENLAYPLRAHSRLDSQQIEKKIKAQLMEFGLQGTENLYPANLSGGMQKRVGLARAMIIEPDVILYDEPTAGLDPFNTKRIQELILKLKGQGVTSILVTHDMPTAIAVCDKMVFLREGRIQAEWEVKQPEVAQESIIQKFMNGELA